MTARSVAALSALLLLGATSVPAASMQVAELVPVEPSLPPAMMYGIPTPDPVPPPVPAAPPAATARPAPGKEGPAELEDGWEGGAAKDKDGKFAYCVIEGRFKSGHVLLIARSPRGETNLGIGIPGAGLPPGQEWPIKISVDNKLTRERVAMASQPDMLVVPNGRDEDLVNALMTGNELVVHSAADRIAFTLKGTKKVLTDLKTCVEKAGNVPPIKTSTGVRTTRLPPGLADLLASAGIRDAEPVSMDNVPKDQRPADVAWRFGPLVGGIRERVVEEGAKLDDLSQTFADAMKARCEGTPTLVMNQTEKAGPVFLRTGSVGCAMKDGTLHVSLTFLLTQNRLFTILFHEALEADIPLADTARDNLARVLRRVALEQASDAGQAPAPVTGQTPAPAAPAQATPAQPAATPAQAPAETPAQPAAQSAAPPVPPAVLSGKPARR